MTKNRRRLARTAVAIAALTFSFVTQTDSGLASTTHSHRRISAHAHPAKKARTAGALPAEGMFDGCDFGANLTTCEQDLVQMHQAGMQVVVAPLEGHSLQDATAYATYAQGIGMSVMWQLNDPGFWGGAWVGSSAAADWPQFSTACGCTGTAQVLSYMIHWLAALPATYGYYAADDWTLTPGDAGGLKQYVGEIKSVDPSHMVMVGSAEGDGTTYYSSGATMGNEIYPETTRSLMPYNTNLDTWQSVHDSIAQDQRAATRSGTPAAFILQAFTFGDNIPDGEAVGVCTAAMSQAACANLLHYPSSSVQLELRNMVLQNAQPKLILWYKYSEASQGSRWADLTSVIKAAVPTTASAARAKRAHRVASKHRARRPGALKA